MNRFLSQGTTPPIVLATILALGILVVWAFVSAYASALLSVPTTSESLDLTRDGKAYITRFDPATRVNTYRTLEGEPIDDASFFKLSGEPQSGAPESGYLRAADRRPGYSREKLNWSRRVVGFRDHGSPPAYWYEMKGAGPDSPAYFVGYDSRSKLLIGYIGRGGFRPAPPVEDQFTEVTDDGFQYPRFGAYGSEPYRGPTADSLVFVVSAERLLGVDITRRTVREIDLPGSVVSLAEYEATVQPGPMPGDGGVPSDAPSTAVRVVVRTIDEIVILDGLGKIIRRQPVPKPLADKIFNLYFCSKEMVFETGTYPAAAETHELYWVNEEGEITRQADVRLLGRDIARNPRQSAWQMLGLLPAPGLIALGCLLWNPLDYVAEGKSSNFLEALARSLNEVWPPLLAICAVGVVLALLVYRRHRRVSARGATTWAVFVFLAGVPGLLAYWLHRRWPVREQCAKCGTLAPRDRDECLSCGQPFPTPALVGSEIFA